MKNVAGKSKKIIRNVSELPSWYSLSKYQGLSSFDATGWYEVLLQREQHFFWFNFQGVEKYKSDHYDGKNPFYDALIQSRKDPLSFLTDDTQIALMGGGQLGALRYDKKSFSTFSHAISPLTIRGLYQNEHRLKKNTRVRIRKWMDHIFDSFGGMTDEFKLESAWARSFIDDPIFEAFKKQGGDRFYRDRKRGHDLVQIDLTVPDKILIEQFTDYLRQVRRKNPEIKPAKTFKYPEYQKWIEYGLLPYLDLKLWEIENDVSIPNRVFADAISSEGSMGEEMIRKTTKKIADQVMDRDYIDFLATIAAQEIAEKI